MTYLFNNNECDNYCVIGSGATAALDVIACIIVSKALVQSISLLITVKYIEFIQSIL